MRLGQYAERRLTLLRLRVLLEPMFKHDLGDGAELRILERRHAAEFLEFVAQNRAHLNEWLGWGERIQTLEDAERFIERGVKQFASESLPTVGIWQNGALVGGILFFPLQAMIQATEIGYWLGAGAQGRGLMFRAVRAMLAYVFEELRLNRVALHADVDNLRSQRLAERLGFQREGLERESWLLHGAYRDNVAYAMLARDWQALRQA